MFKELLKAPKALYEKIPKKTLTSEQREVVGKLSMEFFPPMLSVDVISALKAGEEIGFVVTSNYDLYLTNLELGTLQGELRTNLNRPRATGSIRLKTKTGKIHCEYQFSENDDIPKAIEEKVKVFLKSQEADLKA